MASFTEQANAKLVDQSTPQINKIQRSPFHYDMREIHYDRIERELGTLAG